MHRKPALKESAAAPSIRDDYTLLPAGKVAAVITHLEMRAPVPLRPEPDAHRFTLRHAAQPDLNWYRGLYRRVGENWLWFSRLVLDDRALRSLIQGPAIQVHVLVHDGRDRGILELDLRRFPEVEISFLGLERELIGSGAGRFLMNRTLEIAWARNPRRVTVHTCTFDHPGALAFYLRTGFVPYARSLEVADDPRLAGLLPRSAAPHVPLLESD